MNDLKEKLFIENDLCEHILARYGIELHEHPEIEKLSKLIQELIDKK